MCAGVERFTPDLRQGFERLIAGHTIFKLRQWGDVVIAFWTSFLLVTLAEMGDKTQLLAMAFAVRYPWPVVLAGVFVATVFNHLLAVAAGNYLTGVVPLQYIKVAAAALFIVFGLWTLRGDELAGEADAVRGNPFWTVAVAFFFAEMGDKTQLATLALAARYQTIIPVWLGTTAGMMAADGIGIGVGVIMGRRIPERLIKWGAAFVFIAFGLAGLYEFLPRRLLSFPAVAAGLTVLAVLVYFLARRGNGRLPDGRS
jgi:Predicted membrane protein